VRKRCEIELERIGLVQLESTAAESFAQRGSEVAIDFDGIEAAAGLEQRVGEGTSPGTDFDECLARLRCDRLDDVLDHLRVVQEVLTESLAGEYHLRAVAFFQ
jgi:hypothetical protein